MVGEAEDFTAVVEVEDSAGAEDFQVDVGSPAAVRSAVALAGVHFVAAATSAVVTAAFVAATVVDGADTGEDGAGMDSVSV